MSSFKLEEYTPLFLNTPEKWMRVVVATDTHEKFDDLACKILEEDDIDPFEFRTLINDLAVDIKRVHPLSGHIITDLIKSINALTDSMIELMPTKISVDEKKLAKYDEDFAVCDCLEDIYGGTDYIENESVNMFKNMSMKCNPPTYTDIVNDHWKPKHKEYISLKSRLDSFESWPKQINPKPMELAEAGFFYTGQSDVTTCFHCGVVIYNWEVMDIAKMEHRKFKPLCPFIQYIM